MSALFQPIWDYFELVKEHWRTWTNGRMVPRQITLLDYGNSELVKELVKELLGISMNLWQIIMGSSIKNYFELVKELVRISEHMIGTKTDRIWLLWTGERITRNWWKNYSELANIWLVPREIITGRSITNHFDVNSKHIREHLKPKYMLQKPKYMLLKPTYMLPS